ncbi:hypothetical protein PAF15_01475 [Weissella koreensis]|uniref:hypothetical protein n=1 Tax=Weissella koreensis TaxID=165096 RepID=UPI0022BA4434|nr:hypothetical protein [Weissella koreensis]MCZ9310648.1 hypothetical protein [Weissella koreensis]
MSKFDEALITVKMAMFDIDNIDIDTDEEMEAVLQLESVQQGQLNKLKKLKRKAERQEKIDAAYECMNNIIFEGICSGDFWRDLAIIDLSLEDLRELQADEEWIDYYADRLRSEFIRREKPIKNIVKGED